MMRVMALDQSPLHIGFAYGESNVGIAPFWGVKDFESYSDNNLFLQRDIRLWLTPIIDEFKPDVVFVEDYFLGRHRNTRTLKAQAAVVGAIEAVCEPRGADCFEITVSQWRKRALGKADRPKWATDGEDDWFKEAAMIACARRNWLIDNHHAAEAALIWDYASAAVDKNYMVESRANIERVRLEREDKDRAFNGK